MKKTLSIVALLLLFPLGYGVYLLSHGDVPASERFSAFGFKNDAVAQPQRLNEGTDGEDTSPSGDINDPREREDAQSSRGGDGDSDGSGSPDGSDTTSYDGTEDGRALTPEEAIARYKVNAEGREGTLGYNQGISTYGDPYGSDTSDPYWEVGSGNPSTIPGTQSTSPLLPYTLTILAPTQGQIFNNSGTCTITVCITPPPIAKILWTYGNLAAQMTIELHKVNAEGREGGLGYNKSDLVTILATKILNSGRYTWNHTTALPDGDYKIIIKAYSASGMLLTTAETGYFEVSKTKDSSINTTPGTQSPPLITRSIEGYIIPDPSKPRAPKVAEHDGEKGANGNLGVNGRQNAWAVDPGTFCGNTSPAINRIWYHNLDSLSTYSGTNDFFGIKANEALVYSFVAGPDGEAGGFSFGESTAASMVGSFISVSTSPCDFNASKVITNTQSGVSLDSCYSTRNGINNIAVLSNSKAPVSGYCNLVPGKRYYINYRNQDGLGAPQADSCETLGGGIYCGGLLNIRGLSKLAVSGATTGFKAPDVSINGKEIVPTEVSNIMGGERAYGEEVPFTNLPNNAPLNRLFQTTIDLIKRNGLLRAFGLNANEAVTYRLDIPSWFDGAFLAVDTADHNVLGMDSDEMITVSETRGDFDTTKILQQDPVTNLVSGDPCYRTGLHAGINIHTSQNNRLVYEYETFGTTRNTSVNNSFISQPDKSWLDMQRKITCIIVPGKTYYVNVRFIAPANNPDFKTTDGCAWYGKLNGVQENQEKCATVLKITSFANMDVLKELAGIR